MIKGCEKRVVWLRNTESELFEQAYFILSDAAYEKKKTEGDVVSEAKRIIAQTPITGWWEEPPEKNEKRRHSTVSAKLVFFALGLSVGALPLALVTLLL